MTSYRSAYVKWYLKSHQRRLLIFLGMISLIYVVPTLMSPYDVKYNQLPLVWLCGFALACNLIMAVLLPILQFRFLMKKRSCDLYLPLPIKRNDFFFLQYGIGALLILIPNVMFFIGVALEPASWQYFAYYIVLLLGIYGIAISLYTMLVFFVVKCNSIWDAICASFGFTLATLLLTVTVNEVAQNTVQNVIMGYYGGSANEFFPLDLLNSFLSPVVGAVNWFNGLNDAAYSYATSIGVDLWKEWFSASDFSLWGFLFYGLIWIVCFYGAYHTFCHRKGEDSEQITKSKFVYPLLILLITGSLIFQNILYYSIFWFTFVVFLVLNFVAERKIVVRLRMIVSFLCMVVIAGSFSYLMIDTKGFGLIYEIPEREDLLEIRVSLTLDRNNEIPNFSGVNQYDEIAMLHMTKPVADEVLLDQVYQIHQEAVAYHQSNEVEYNVENYIEIEYVKEDGTAVRRSYACNSGMTQELLDLASYMLEHGYVDEDNIKA